MVKIMGVLNVTPDSLSDGGLYLDLSHALDRAMQMVEEGVDIIDIGGESTRPNSTPISAAEECARILPVIKKLVHKINVPISVDTYHAQTMDAVLSEGVTIINDVNALQDAGALSIVAKYQPTVSLMHKQGQFSTMQKNPSYGNVIEETFEFLNERIQACEEAGIPKNKLWIDPGFGFGKTLEHNLKMLGQLSAYQKFELPVLVGISRKSMLDMICDIPKPIDRDAASLAAAVLAMVQGAQILRVHDVLGTKHAVQVYNATQPFWETPKM